MLEVPDYSVMLYDLSDQPIMDISQICTFKLSLVLNDVNTLSLAIDLVQFERLCITTGLNPRNIIYPMKTEIKVIRNGIALFGGIIASVDTELSEDRWTMSVGADSYLQYFSRRYINKNYTNTDRSDIAWDAINTVQSVAYGNLGITRGTTAPTFNSDLTNDYQDVKYIIQRYTYAKPTTYDFEITPFKVFNTYLRLGSDRPDIELVYPQNIVSIKIPRASDSLANRIIGFGSGIGEERIQTIQQDITSQMTYRILERKQTFNSVEDLTTLVQNTSGVLDNSRAVLVLPDVVTNGTFFNPSDVRVGDSIKLRVDSSLFNNDIDGMVRIYKQEIDVDQNYNETINLGFYNPNAGGEIEDDS